MSSRSIQFLIVAVCLVLLPANTARTDDDRREVKADAITLEVPANWVQQEPSNRLRLTQFEVPPADEEGEPAELSVFAFGAGGTVREQVTRWRDQFQGPERKIQVKTGESPHGDYVFVDLSGTYNKPVGPPVFGRTEPMPEARMLVAMIAVEGKGNYFLKLVGPQKTVEANLEAFRTAFGASDEDEPLDVALR